MIILTTYIKYIAFIRLVVIMDYSYILYFLIAPLMGRKDEVIMKATLNFANINNDALTMVSNCQLAITALAISEKALKDMKDALKEKGHDKESIKALTTKESAQRRADKERADGMCIAFITRYVGMNDCIAGNLYNFDMVSFLQNIGVLSDGEETAKTVKKVDAFRALVVNRKKVSVTRRKNGTDYLTLGETTDVKNTPIELVLSIILAMVESGAIEYNAGGLVVKQFD